MHDLLDALNVRGLVRHVLVGSAIWFCFPLAMVCVSLAQALLEIAVDANLAACVLLSVVVWLCWTAWHSHYFAAHRTRLLKAGDGAYRRAFLQDIFPGITIGFAQMLRPLFNGPTLQSRPSLIDRPPTWVFWCCAGLGLTILLGATGLFLAAWHTLGAARVGFVQEFKGFDTFQPSRRGPYSRVRHPLFWSGIGVSVGLALAIAEPVSLALSAVNLAYGFLYNQLEDRRLEHVFGSSYADYAKEVPPIIPRRPTTGVQQTGQFLTTWDSEK
jgi:protein-S-isoprenylcysteine O-methyltransferase Ste14